MADTEHIPTIAIVGRPNVGKSTLFNRLTGRRTALVSDLPGLTRDRREERTEIGGRPIRIVDTAGLEEAAAGTIPARMRAQTETAIEAADAILFVLDAREGVTGSDKAFARIVRASGKPVVTVANKCEGRAGQEGQWEAFELGLGEPVAISAEHGEGIVDLESDILATLGLKPVVRPGRGGRRRGEAPEAETAEAEAEADDAAASPATTRPVRIAIVGRPNAGKSTLINALLGEERMLTGPEPGLTRDSIASDHVYKGRAIRLFDTAGLRKKARISEKAEKLAASDAVRAIRFAEVVVLLVDAEHPFEHQDLTIGDLAATEGRALVVAVNKWDLIEEKQKALKRLKELLEGGLAQVAGIRMVPISALSGRGLDKLMDAALATYEVWNKRVPTADLNRWLAGAMERNSPPALRGKRIKIRYMTQPSARPPTFVAFCSRADDVPKSYLRYLINSLRETFEFSGVPIRLNLRKGENPYAN